MEAAPMPLVVSSTSEPIVTAIRRVARARDVPAQFVTHREYVSGVSLSVDSRGARVAPDVPLLMFPLPPSVSPDDEAQDDAFLQGESAAVLWAAAFLCRGRVINRPSLIGRVGLASGLAAIDVRRAKMSDTAHAVAVLASEVRALPDDVWATRSYVDGLCAWSTALGPADGPLIARSTRRSDYYERITVVGARTWCQAPGSPLSGGLRSASLELCQALALDYATVTWELDETFDKALVATLDVFPTGRVLGPQVDAVAGALLDHLIAP